MKSITNFLSEVFSTKEPSNHEKQFGRRILLELSTVVLASIGFAIAMNGFEDSGEIWMQDGARYCNNGAMIRDMIVSGGYWDPIAFAKENYVQFPVHNIPYHPPGYATLLGIWFYCFGQSYFMARLFVALCFSGSLLVFRQILLSLGYSRVNSLLAAAMFGCLPQSIIWSRTCMSEFPSMLFILLFVWLFILSVRCSRAKIAVGFSFLAFFFAAIAFFCRVSTSGLVPVMFVYLAYANGVRSWFQLRYFIPAIAYLAGGYFWIKFAGRFASSEMRSSLAESLSTAFNTDNIFIWLTRLPDMVSLPVFIFAVFGVASGVRTKESRKLLAFWTIWFFGYYLFQILQSSHYEARYFIYALPAIVGFSSLCLMNTHWFRGAVRNLLVVVFIGTISLNMLFPRQIPKGLVGFEDVADSASHALSDPGNVLVACFGDSDLIFRLRCSKELVGRRVVRGDRVLAIRNPSYSNKTTVIKVKSKTDVLDILRKGAIRVVVTQGPYDDHDGTWREEPESALCHESLVDATSNYRHVSEHVVTMGSRRMKMHVWQFSGELDSLECNLPVIIPTAGIEL